MPPPEGPSPLDNEALLRDALSSAHLALWTWNPETETMRWSGPVEDLIGLRPDAEPVTVEDLLQQVHPDDRERIRSRLRYSAEQRASFDLEFRTESSSPRNSHWLCLKGHPSTSDTDTRELVGTLHEVTARRRAERLQDQARREFELLREVSPIGLVLSSPEGIIRQVNPAFEEQFGFSEDEVVNTNVEELDLWVEPEDREIVLDKLRSNGRVREFPIRLRTASGEEREVEVSVGYIQREQETRLLWAIQDVTERNRQRQRTTKEGFSDPLTGLPNRDLLLDRSEKAFARSDRSGEPLALLYVDIVDFSAINEEFGHSVGDELLATIAERIRRTVRSSDTVARPKRAADSVARIAGDEFALILEESGQEGAQAVVDRLVEHLEAPFQIADHDIHLIVNFGIAVRQPRAEDYLRPEDLLQAAETAIYRVKRKDQRIHIFHPDDEKSSTRLLRQEKLRRALKEDEFVLYYQPIVDLRDRSVSDAEVLVRWEHPERGLVSPAEFIPLAEETGLIWNLDQWVLREGLRQVASWRKEGRGVDRISVNVTAHQKARQEFQEAVMGSLEQWNLPGNVLTLELTERVAFRYARPFAQLRQSGVRLAIDDFGTGYSALFYLREFDADVIKIDQGFIEELDTDTQADILVHAALDLADRLDISAIAEGIETEEQLAQLRDLGCSLGQGYLFARPVPADEFEAFVDEHEWAG